MTQVQKLRSRNRGRSLPHMDLCIHSENLSLSLLIARIPEGLFCYAKPIMSMTFSSICHIYMELYFPFKKYSGIGSLFPPLTSRGGDIMLSAWLLFTMYIFQIFICGCDFTKLSCYLVWLLSLSAQHLALFLEVRGFSENKCYVYFELECTLHTRITFKIPFLIFTRLQRPNCSFDQ